MKTLFNLGHHCLSHSTRCTYNFNLPGLVVLSAIMLMAIPFYLYDKKHTTRLDSLAHTLFVPELGLAMADGGEKVASSGKVSGRASENLSSPALWGKTCRRGCLETSSPRRPGTVKSRSIQPLEGELVV